MNSSGHTAKSLANWESGMSVCDVLLDRLLRRDSLLVAAARCLMDRKVGFSEGKVLTRRAFEPSNGVEGGCRE